MSIGALLLLDDGHRGKAAQDPPMTARVTLSNDTMFLGVVLNGEGEAVRAPELFPSAFHPRTPLAARSKIATFEAVMASASSQRAWMGRARDA